MKTYLHVVVFLLSAATGKTQKHDYKWLFGYDSQLGIDGVEGVLLDFNALDVAVSNLKIGCSLNSSNCTFADSTGKLLFYTDGCDVYGSNHEILSSGDSLNYGEVFDLHCGGEGLGYTAGHQSVIALPHPDTSELVWLFYKNISYSDNPDISISTEKLLRTTISFPNGAEEDGLIIEKKKLVLDTALTYGELTAVKHANGKDWWLISPSFQSNTYFTMHCHGEGINIVSQSIGPVLKDGGQACFSPDGSKYARYNSKNGLVVLDFDRLSGELSSPVSVEIPNEDLSNGLAFSPNSKLLYVSAHDTIFQFDLEADNFSESAVVVAVYDGYQSIFNTTFYNAQLAPDCKIYINTFAAVDVLHVIHNPDTRGSNCNVEQHAIDLPYRHLRTLPHFPNYRLGPLIPGEAPPPPCETVVSTPTVPPQAGAGFSLYPNPTSGLTTVEFSTPLSGRANVTLYSLQGQPVLQQTAGEGAQHILLETAALPGGTYFCRVTGVDGITGVKKLVKL